VISANPPVLIDEWQFHPPIWDKVRRAVDARAPAGSFLLTGSSSPAGLGTHSGAGRIPSVRIRPLSFAERGLAEPSVSLAELLGGTRPKPRGDTRLGLVDYTREIVRSGYPGLRGLTDANRETQLDAYASRIVDRDFPELGAEVRNPVALRRWMAAYAAATSTTTALQKIHEAASEGLRQVPARSTVTRYRDALERLFVLDPVPGWLPSGTQLRELGQRPKHHLADPALAAWLVGATGESLLENVEPAPVIPRDGTFLGGLFESLVTLSVRAYAQHARARVSHFRRSSGDHEVDLIVETRDGRVVAIETKLAAIATREDTRHLRWLAEQIGDKLLDTVIITIGQAAYRDPDGVAVVPLALLGP
jgi:hypothetical protein